MKPRPASLNPGGTSLRPGGGGPGAATAPGPGRPVVLGVTVASEWFKFTTGVTGPGPGITVFQRLTGRLTGIMMFVSSSLQVGRGPCELGP